ncbi:hypothetical protein JMJ35_009875 [Cladonia borealis]|uniref:Uncharacterized protein n=1 Tax=Cladonia borealis TaxID=184061 RepID=A0AA39U545_9LECA|nr:hypothetical protein JMJ35_009875 [Cladonia borealis]
MRFSVLLALASGLLTHALPTGPNTSLNAVNARPQWTPDLPYPAGDSAATCPLGPGPNPFSTLEVPERKKRSFTTATHLRRRNQICRQIAHCNVNHFAVQDGNTQEVLLIAGATYVFSWSLNEIIRWITALRNNPDGTSTIIQRTRFDAGRGTMTLNIDQTALVHFQIFFRWIGHIDISGEFALFQIGPG